MRIQLLADAKLNRQDSKKVDSSIENSKIWKKKTEVPKVISINLLATIMLANCLSDKLQANCSIFDLTTSVSNHTSYFVDQDSGQASSEEAPAAQPQPRQTSVPIRRSPFNSTINNQIVFDESEPDEEDEGGGGGGGNEEDEDETAEAEESPENAEEVEDEDDDDFYGRNPVELAKFEAENDKELNGIKFNDFDDYKALRLGEFYSETKGETRKRRKPHREKGLSKKNKMRNKRVEYKTSASANKRTGPTAVSLSECAMFLAESATCLTFASVEWAIKQAKRFLRFRRPEEEELNSLQPSEATVNSIGELIEHTTRLLATRFGLTLDEINFELERQLDVRKTSLWPLCPQIYRRPNSFRSCSSSMRLRQGSWLIGRFRSLTGMCNNPILAHFGASHLPFVRLAPPSYQDNVGAPRRFGSSGLAELPNPRLVALSLHFDLDSPSGGQTALFAHWGQLINHDLALASGARAATGHRGSCCATAASRNSAAGAANSRACMPFRLGRDDPLFGPAGRTCHEFKRSLAALRPGCSLGPRTQLNLVTPYVDASFVYGSSDETGRSLRSGTANGQLRMWNYFGGGRRGRSLKPLLPAQTASGADADEECIWRPGAAAAAATRSRGSGASAPPAACFRSGDARTNQQVPLVALHTIHAREHNRLARALSALNPHWSSARTFEEARRIHVAQVQHILLNEYLPSLLGAKQLKLYNLLESDLGEYFDGYEPTAQVAISQEFAAAAFRQGHSSVPSNVFRVDTQTRLPTRVYRLRELFRQPWPLFEPLALDEFLLGLAESSAQNVDQFVSAEVGGHLLEEPSEQVGLDLIAINIQRGRDQGLASYNSMRDWCGLARFGSFDELSGVMSEQSASVLAALYESVDDVDLFSGGLSERPLEGALIGPTFACIIGRQFEQLRAGDRHWFDSAALGAHAFTLQQLDSIKQFTLARMICANSDRLYSIQSLAMSLAHPILNPVQPCASLPDIDLALWAERTPLAADSGGGGGGGELRRGARNRRAE